LAWSTPSQLYLVGITRSLTSILFSRFS
jgi:hypothetical protein